MKRLAACTVVAGLLGVEGPASAHRLDEYLQATVLTLGRDQVHASLRLVPGVAVAAEVLAAVDENRDGLVSAAEERAYAERVLADLTLALDGRPLTPTLVSAVFPSVEQMREGMGEIQIELAADVPVTSVARRRLVVENRHASEHAAYLMNCLAPSDPGLEVVAQQRNDSQSHYEVTYQAAAPLASLAGFYQLAERLVGR